MNQVLPHLFRTEYSKLVSVLAKRFGLQQIEIAEDLASETFLLAAETWAYKGIPANPVAWLYAVARNKTLNFLVRTNLFNQKIAATIPPTAEEDHPLDLSDGNIKDSQLRMLFAVCHPALSSKEQVALALRILCGFGLSEVADAFLTNEEVIHKRLQRAKEKIRRAGIALEVPEGAHLTERLSSVIQIIYLVFSEGYYSESNKALIRKDLCVEAINLCYFLLENPVTNTHDTNALMALMCFQASRLDARQTATGDLILYADQDRTLWDGEFIEKGFHYLQKASRWDHTSRYYLEASIAYWYTVPETMTEKWSSILKLYDALLVIEDSPMAALSRIYALANVQGSSVALEEALKLNLKDNHFYYVLLADLYKTVDPSQVRSNLLRALTLCKSEREKELLHKKLTALDSE